MTLQLSSAPSHPASEALTQSPRLAGLGIVQTVHCSRGRLRLRMRGLRFNEQAARALEEAIRGVEGVVSSSASELTGNLLVQFTPELRPEAVRELVRGVLAVRGAKGLPGVVVRHGEPEGMLRPTDGVVPARNPSDGSVQPDALAAAAAQPWHHISAEDTLRALGVQDTGLTVKDAETRLARLGPNRLPKPEPRSNWALLLDQVKSVPVLLLVGSAAVSLFTGGVVDAIVIGAVVVTNAVIGFATEKHAQRTIAALTAAGSPDALVVREGRVLKVDAAQITVGDLIPLSPGAYIPADARLVEPRHLTVAEAALTGESSPVAKTAEIVGASTPLADRRNMVYRGTVVVGGSGLAVVTAIGSSTEIGRLHTLMNESSRPDTPMERQLDVLGRQTALGALAVCGLTLLLGGLRGLGFVSTLQAAVSLAVAALPEGLPSMATTALVSGMVRMRRENVLARSLGVVEAAGSIDVLCLDKTGTLTMNQMSAVEVYSGGERLNMDAVKRMMAPAHREAAVHLELLLAVCALCSEANVAPHGSKRRFEGSATEVALLELAQKNLVDVRSIRHKFPLLDVQLRAEGRNYMITVHAAQNGRRFVAIKGRPDQVLEKCRTHAVGSGVRTLSKSDRSRILAENDRLAAKGRRVLGIAYCQTGPERPAPLDPQHDGLKNGRKESSTHRVQNQPADDFVWLGLVALADPPRAEAEAAIRALHKAGITTRMITGDQAATAYAIGQEVGLFDEGEQAALWDASREDAGPLGEASAAESRIFSRVTPSQKLDIVRALQAQGHIVAMTGDGINDGPALKAANVGIALGAQSTETARESADLVLRDDDLRGLLVAIREGRTIHGNIRQAIHFLIATNLSEVLTVLGSIAFGLGQPISPRQLLWLNVVTDILPVLALAVEPPRPGALELPPPRPNEPLIHKRQLPVMVAESALISGAAGASFVYGLARYGSDVASTMAFLSLSSAQLMHTVLSRSANDRRQGAPASASRYYVPIAVIGSFGLQALTMLTPLGGVLGLTPLGWADLAVVLASIAGAALGTLAVQHWVAKPRREESPERGLALGDGTPHRLEEDQALDMPEPQLALPG